MTKQERELIESSINPFTTDLTIPVRIYSKIKRVVDTQDIVEGIVTAIPDTITSKVLVEEEDYTKVFNRSGFRLHIMALSKQAKAVLFWFIYEVDLNLDYMWFNKTRYKSECGGSWTDINTGIAELIQAGIIQTTLVRDVYWINPRIFFQGNRLKKYYDKLVER